METKWNRTGKWRILIMKKLIMFFMVMAIAVPIFSGIASAQNAPVCVTICPAGAGPDDEITLTAYDEGGEFVDLSLVEGVEMNFWGSGVDDDGFWIQPGDDEMVDGTLVIVLGEDRYDSDEWDFFTLIPGEWEQWLPIAMPGFAEGALFDYIPDAVDAGGTCEELAGCVGDDPIAIDPNVMLVYETGETVGDFGISLNNALPTGKTATVTVDPNQAADDITLLGGDPCDGGTITLTFNDSNWDVPQKVAYKAIDDVIAEPPNLEETQSIVVTSVYSETLQDPNWAGEKIVKVGVIDNDQANILFTITPSYTTGSPGAGIPVTGPVQIWEEPKNFFGFPQTRYRDIGVTLQVQPSGGDVRIVVFNEGDYPAIMDPPLTETSEPNALIFTDANWDVSQTITITANEDDVLQAEEAEAEGDQNYQAEIVFFVDDDGGDERFSPLNDDEEPEGIVRVVNIDIEDNECGAFGISYLDIGNPNAATDPNYQDGDGNPLPDCYVDIYDVIEFAIQWLDCSDPQTEGCESYL
jgi:hypothetical protein